MSKLIQGTFCLTPERIFHKELLAVGLPIPDIQGRKNLWQKLTFTEGVNDKIDEMLGLETLLADTGAEGHRYRLLAAGLLSRDRWGKKFRAVILEN